MFRFTQHRRLTIAFLIIAPSLLLLLLVTTHVIPLYSRGGLLIFATPTIPNIDRPPLQLSSDPYTNSNSQHQTELEPDTYSHNSTIVTAFQAGRFIAYVRVTLDQVTVRMVQAYEQTLAGMEDTTIARKLAAVKSLLTYAHKEGYIRFNVGAGISLPAIRTRLAERILSREQVDDLIGKETDAYNHALLRLLYSTGIRVSEACGLMWRDVQPRDNGKAQVTVFGKGGKERAVLVSADTYKELLALRTEDDQVFPNLYARKAERIIERASKRAGIDGAVSPHWLRHANASHALDRGAPIHVVQSTLGHASLATTSKYTHARPNDSTGEYLGY